jgi:hypothetical protein
MKPKSKSRCWRPFRSRYSLRALLLVFVVVAFPSAWLRSSYVQAFRQQQVIQELKEMGFETGYDFQGYSDESGIPWRSHPVAGEAWVTDLFGVDFLASPPEMLIQNAARFSPGHYRNITSDQLNGLDDISRLKLLSLDHCRIDEPMLLRIAKLKRLKFLFVRDAGLSDADVARLQRLLRDCEIVTQS